MTFISYAQNFEDIMLWRALKHVENGFYIDVGANDPEEDSVTKAFYDHGWHGINVEPLPEYHQQLCEKRPRDINLALAAGATDGELTLYDIPSVRGWASSNKTVAEHHQQQGFAVKKMIVPVRTLTKICEEYATGDNIHFLKIDVEGFEAEVIRGMDFQVWRPWILIVEATLPNSRTTNHESWEPTLTERNYHFTYFDGLNRYYIAEEHKELSQAFSTQPNVFDNFITFGHIRAVEAARRSEAKVQEVQQQLATLNNIRLLSHIESLGEAKDSHTQALIQSAEAIVSAAEAQLETIRTQAQATQVRAQEVEVQAQRAEAQAQEAEARTQEAEARTQRAEVWAQEAEVQRQHLQVLMDALQNQLQAVYASTSWRITTPLRWAGVIKMKCKELLRHPLKSLRKLAKHVLSALMCCAMQLIKRSPTLTQSARNLYARFPVLGERMLRLTHKPVPADVGNQMRQELVALSDAPSAWEQTVSPARHFKMMLSQELQRRQNNKH